MKSSADQTLCFSAYYLCLIDAFLLGLSTFSALPFKNTLSLALRMAALGLVLLKVVIDRYYSLQMLLTLACVAGVFLLTYWNSSYSHLLYLCVVCLSLRYIDVRQFVTIDFWSRLSMGLFIMLCGLLGIIENYITYRTGSTTLRYSLGFGHPNTLATIAFSLIVEDAWLKKREVTKWYTLLIWIIAGIVYAITTNRTVVYLMIVFPVALFFVQNRSVDREIKRDGGTWYAMLFPLAVLFSFVLMILCDSVGIFDTLDNFLSNRFHNAANLYEVYGIPLLGQKVTLVSVKMARLNETAIALLDVAYLRILIQAGPIALLLLIALYTKIMHKAWTENDAMLSLILMMFVLFGLCESGFNNPYLNFTLILAAKELLYAEDSEVPRGALHLASSV